MRVSSDSQYAGAKLNNKIIKSVAKTVAKKEAKTELGKPRNCNWL